MPQIQAEMPYKGGLFYKVMSLPYLAKINAFNLSVMRLIRQGLNKDVILTKARQMPTSTIITVIRHRCGYLLRSGCNSLTNKTQLPLTRGALCLIITYLF